MLKMQMTFGPTQKMKILGYLSFWLKRRNRKKTQHNKKNQPQKPF